MTVRCFIAQSFSISPLHHLDMTSGVDRDVKHQIIIVILVSLYEVCKKEPHVGAVCAEKSFQCVSSSLSTCG